MFSASLDWLAQESEITLECRCAIPSLIAPEGSILTEPETMLSAMIRTDFSMEMAIARRPQRTIA
jgi:hypothetical protein